MSWAEASRPCTLLASYVHLSGSRGQHGRALDVVPRSLAASAGGGPVVRPELPSRPRARRRCKSDTRDYGTTRRERGRNWTASRARTADAVRTFPLPRPWAAEDAANGDHEMAGPSDGPPPRGRPRGVQAMSGQLHSPQIEDAADEHHRLANVSRWPPEASRRGRRGITPRRPPAGQQWQVPGKALVAAQHNARRDYRRGPPPPACPNR